jgi:hypothetical protein
MSARRVACRVALTMQRENPRRGGVRAGSLARKVFRRLPTKGSFNGALYWFTCALVRLRQIGGCGIHGWCGRPVWSSAGVWPAPKLLNTRRLALPGSPALTPFITSTLVTKGCRNEA